MGIGEHVQRVFGPLNRREEHRRLLGLANLRDKDTSPEAQFYSVKRAVKLKGVNRYADVLAYDRSAVGEEGLEVNANVVRDPAGRWWVAAQAPLPDNFHAFFYNIYNRTASSHPAVAPADTNPEPRFPRRTAILVQLTGWAEHGVRKADPYIPDDEHDLVFSSHLDLPDIEVQRINTQHLPAAGTRLTELRLILDPKEPGSDDGARDAQTEHSGMLLWHYHFLDWRDRGVPQGKGVEELRELVLEVERRREEAGGKDACEVWVHCSAGVGRTGTFLALSSLLVPPYQEVAPRSSLPDYLRLNDIPEAMKGDKVAMTVDELREWRSMLIQSPEQLALLYHLTQEKA